MSMITVNNLGHHRHDNLMKIKALSYAFGFFLVAIVNSAIALSNKPLPAQVDTSSLIDAILGPFGALALSLFGLYWAGKLIMKLVNRNDAMHKEVIEQYEKRIQDLKEGRNKNTSDIVD